MSESRPVFFYGLFMDESLLRDKGAYPVGMRRVALPGFELRVGQRATLVRNSAATVHGMLASLSQTELDRLYSDPAVRDYQPEMVVADDEGVSIPALCYILPAPAASAANADYAARLRALAQRLGLPADYVATIR